MSRETKEIIRCDRCGRICSGLTKQYLVRFNYSGDMDNPPMTGPSVQWKDLCKRCYTFACRIHREITAPAGKNKETKEDEASV